MGDALHIRKVVVVSSVRHIKLQMIVFRHFELYYTSMIL